MEPVQQRLKYVPPVHVSMIGFATCTSYRMACHIHVAKMGIVSLTLSCTVLTYYIDPGEALSLTKGEILRSALTTSQYTKLSNFPDSPLPPEVLELLNVQKMQPNQQPSVCNLLARQNRMVKPIVGDGNCFFVLYHK